MGTAVRAPQMLLTVNQTASATGIPPHEVRRLIAAGLLPSVRLSPRRVRVLRAALEVWLEEQNERALARGYEVTLMNAQARPPGQACAATTVPTLPAPGIDRATVERAAEAIADGDTGYALALLVGALESDGPLPPRCGVCGHTPFRLRARAYLVGTPSERGEP